VAGNGQLDWPMTGTAPAALPPRGWHHHAVLGVSGDNGGYDECCCRFDSLCEMLRASTKATPGTTTHTLFAAPTAGAAKSTVAGGARRKRARKPVKPAGPA
jgi:hypothetical protein